MADLIDRQKTKAAFEPWLNVKGYSEGELNMLKAVLYEITVMPSAQPDLDEWCTDCKEYDQDKHCCPRWTRVIRQTLKDAQPESQWIPCSERLPEESGRYLISVLDGVGRRTTVAPYQPRCKAWAMTGRMAYWKVIAWMPLPEPAKLGGD